MLQKPSETDSYTLPINTNGRMPKLILPALDDVILNDDFKRHRASGRLFGHAKYSNTNPNTLCITSDAYPELWMEVAMKSLEPPKKKQKQHKYKGLVDRYSMMEQFFDWKITENIVEGDDDNISIELIFCTLKIDLGKFKKGDEFYRVDFDIGQSVMNLFLNKDDDDPIAQIPLQLIAL